MKYIIKATKNNDIVEVKFSGTDEEILFALSSIFYGLLAHKPDLIGSFLIDPKPLEGKDDKVKE